MSEPSTLHPPNPQPSTLQNPNPPPSQPSTLHPSPSIPKLSAQAHPDQLFRLKAEFQILRSCNPANESSKGAGICTRVDSGNKGPGLNPFRSNVVGSQGELLSSKLGTNKLVGAKLLPWLEPFSVRDSLKIFQVFPLGLAVSTTRLPNASASQISEPSAQAHPDQLFRLKAEFRILKGKASVLPP